MKCRLKISGIFDNIFNHYEKRVEERRLKVWETCTSAVLLPTMKSSLEPCSHPALRNSHSIQALPVSLEERKLFEGRDGDLAAFISLEPSTELGVSAQAVFGE